MLARYQLSVIGCPGNCRGFLFPLGRAGNRRRHQNTVAHTVNEFFVGGNDGGERGLRQCEDDLSDSSAWASASSMPFGPKFHDTPNLSFIQPSADCWVPVESFFRK